MSKQNFAPPSSIWTGRCWTPGYDLAACADKALSLRLAGAYDGRVPDVYRKRHSEALKPEPSRPERARRISKRFCASILPITRSTAPSTRGFFPGVEKTIRTLHERGYLLAVLSNKTEATAKKIIDRYFPDAPFLRRLGQQWCKAAQARDGCRILASERARLQAEEVFYVGDGDTGHGVCQPHGLLCRRGDLGLPSGGGAEALRRGRAVFVHGRDSSVSSVEGFQRHPKKHKR